MEYTEKYKTIFASARNILDDDITREVKYITYGISIKHQHSLAYLKLVADNLTVYNELTNLSFFCRCKHFNN